jgi:hypothetical protein
VRYSEATLRRFRVNVDDFTQGAAAQVWWCSGVIYIQNNSIYGFPATVDCWVSSCLDAILSQYECIKMEFLLRSECLPTLLDFTQGNDNELWWCWEVIFVQNESISPFHDIVNFWVSFMFWCQCTVTLWI